VTITEPFPNLEGPLFLPVNGPAPYNTLVVVQGVSSNSAGVSIPITGTPWNAQATLITTFTLPGWDPRVGPPLFEHSTTAWLTQIWANDIKDYTFAVNDIANAFFDHTGTWNVVFDVNGQAQGDQNDPTGAFFAPGSVWFAFSSWILCSLPPVPSSAKRATQSKPRRK
jgi:hypothetical protein